MTPARLAELKALATAPELTDGPWRVDQFRVVADDVAFPDPLPLVAGRVSTNPSDLALMAAARLGVPELVAEVERLGAENASLKGQLTRAWRMMSRLLPPV